MNIEVTESELGAQGYTVPQFRGLQLAEQRWIAAAILRTRGTELDNQRARLVDLAHPDFSLYKILLGH